MGGGNSADFFSATASLVFSRGFFSRAATPLRTPLTRQGIPAMKQTSGDGRLLLRLWLQLLKIRQCDVYGPDGPTQEVGESEAHTAHAPHGRLVGDTRLGKEIATCVSIHGQKFECI
uniref:Uncharacterized protein n=1 Tax=Oryza rufipogon TaxID=4529 RepID=A0A0E0R2D4_ORYRU